MLPSSVGFPGSQPDLCRLHNQYLLESASRYPHRLIAFLSLSLFRSGVAMNELENGIREGARGVGEVAFYHREMTVQDLDLMRPVLTRDGREKDPLTPPYQRNHRPFIPRKGRNPSRTVLRIGSFLSESSHCPGPLGRRASFLRTHAGGGKAFVNVYYDTAASPFSIPKRFIAWDAKLSGADKILFGSDFPLDFTQEVFSGDGGIGSEEGRSEERFLASIFQDCLDGPTLMLF